MTGVKNMTNTERQTIEKIRNCESPEEKLELIIAHLERVLESCDQLSDDPDLELCAEA
jgi:hypothetical protein